jgi:hypothetical protein
MAKKETMTRSAIIAFLMAFTMLLSASAAFMTVAQSEENHPPDIMSNPDEWAWAGIEYSYDVLAIDYDEDELVYRLWYKPDGMTIDNVTGKIRWTPTTEQSGVTHIVGLEVIDVHGAKAMQNWTIDVYEPPAPWVDIWNPYYGQEVSGIITIQGMIYSEWWGDGKENRTVRYNLILEIWDTEKVVLWNYEEELVSEEPYMGGQFFVDLDTREFANGEYYLMATATDNMGLTGTNQVDFSINNDHSGDYLWFIYPQSGAMVDGYIEIEGGADKNKVDKVQIRIEDTYNYKTVLDWTTASGVAEWMYGFNFTGLSEYGTCYEITAKALNEGKDVDKETVTVCTEQGPWPPPPPPGQIEVWIEQPVMDAVVSGITKVIIRIKAENVKFLIGELEIMDSSGLAQAETFELDLTTGELEYVSEWDTTLMADGEALLYVMVMDEEGDMWGEHRVQVKIDNTNPPPPPPTKKIDIKLTSPMDGAVISGKVAVTGKVFYEENVRTLRVNIMIDGKQLTEILSSGGEWRDFSFELDTSKYADGRHKLTAVTEVGENKAEATLTLEFKNEGTPPPPPPPPPIVPEGDVNKKGEIDHEGKEVDFEAPVYPDMDQENLDITWDFGDGTTSTEKNPTHKYEEEGSYEVKVTVSDGQTTEEGSATLNVNKRSHVTRTPGFGTTVLVLGLMMGALVAFFRRRK